MTSKMAFVRVENETDVAARWVRQMFESRMRAVYRGGSQTAVRSALEWTQRVRRRKARLDLAYVGDPYQVAQLTPRAHRLLADAAQVSGIWQTALNRLRAPSPLISICGIVGSAKHHLVNLFLRNFAEHRVLRAHLGPRHTTLAALGELLLRGAAENGWLNDLSVLHELQLVGDSRFNDFYEAFDTVIGPDQPLIVVIDDLQWLDDPDAFETIAVSLRRWPRLRGIVTSTDDAALLNACAQEHIAFSAIQERELFYTPEQTDRLCAQAGAERSAARCWELAHGHPLATALAIDLLLDRPDADLGRATEWITAMIAQIAEKTLPDRSESELEQASTYSQFLAKCAELPAFTRTMLSNLHEGAHCDAHLDRLFNGPLVQVSSEVIDGEPVYRWPAPGQIAPVKAIASLRAPSMDQVTGERIAGYLAEHGLISDALALLINLHALVELERMCQAHLFEIAGAPNIIRLLTRGLSAVSSPPNAYPHLALLRLTADVLFSADEATTLHLLHLLNSTECAELLARTPGAPELLQSLTLAVALAAGDIRTATGLLDSATSPSVSRVSDFSKTGWPAVLRALTLLASDHPGQALRALVPAQQSRVRPSGHDTRLVVIKCTEMLEAITVGTFGQPTGADTPHFDLATGDTIDCLMNAFAAITSAWQLVDCGQLAEAEQVLCVSPDLVPAPLRPEYLSLKALLLVSHQPEQARSLTHEHRVRQSMVSPTWVSQRLLLVEVLAELRCGDINRARHLVGTFAPDRSIPWAALSHAVISLADGANDRAYSVISQSLSSAHSFESSRTNRVMHLVAAISAARLGQQTAAATHLLRAIADYPEHAVLLLLTLTAATDLPLLKEALVFSAQTTASPNIADIQRLLIEASEQGTHLLPMAVKPVTLTRRERLVFEGLRSGLSYNEIASSLFVSTNTVKSQVRSLYAKLGVSRRDEALTKAALLGW